MKPLRDVVMAGEGFARWGRTPCGGVIGKEQGKWGAAPQGWPVAWRLEILARSLGLGAGGVSGR